VFFVGNNMGGFFVAWVLLFFFKKLLIEDLDEGKVFFLKIQTRKRQEIF